MSGVFECELIFFTAPFLVDWFTSHRFENAAVYGLHCRNRHPARLQRADDAITDQKRETLEPEMGKRDPYRNTAYYIQFIARKR